MRSSGAEQATATRKVSSDNESTHCRTIISLCNFGTFALPSSVRASFSVITMEFKVSQRAWLLCPESGAFEAGAITKQRRGNHVRDF
jgi:hypothetical protein